MGQLVRGHLQIGLVLDPHLADARAIEAQRPLHRLFNPALVQGAAQRLDQGRKHFLSGQWSRAIGERFARGHWLRRAAVGLGRKPDIVRARRGHGLRCCFLGGALRSGRLRATKPAHAVDLDALTFQLLDQDLVGITTLAHDLLGNRLGSLGLDFQPVLLGNAIQLRDGAFDLRLEVGLRPLGLHLLDQRPVELGIDLPLPGLLEEIQDLGDGRAGAALGNSEVARLPELLTNLVQRTACVFDQLAGERDVLLKIAVADQAMPFGVLNAAGRSDELQSVSWRVADARSLGRGPGQVNQVALPACPGVE
jgi:hypothetical protein